MTKEKFLILFVASTINSTGSWVLWLMFGPYATSHYELYGLGVLAALRQLGFLVGSFFFADVADRSKNLKKSTLLVIVTQLIVGMALLFYSYFVLKPSIAFFILWITLRFFLSSIEFLFVFKLMGQYPVGWGKSSILHLLTTQGATVFGSIIVLGLSTIRVASMSVAILFDLLTSVVMLLCIIFIKPEVSTIASRGVSLKTRLVTNVNIFWQKKFYPWNIIQVLLLLSCSGLVVNMMAVSQNSLISEKTYSGLQLGYGIAFWVTGFLSLQKFTSRHTIPTSIVLCIIFSLMDNYLSDVFGKYVVISLHIISMGLIVHSTNKAISDLSDDENSSKIRSASIVYLSLLFSFGEWVFGYSMSHEVKSYANIFFRVIPALIAGAFYYKTVISKSP